MVVRISVCRTREAWKQLFVLLLSAQTALLVSAVDDSVCVSAFQAAENSVKSCHKPNVECCNLASKFLIFNGRPLACLCRSLHMAHLRATLKRGNITSWPIRCGTFVAQYKALCLEHSHEKDAINNLRRDTDILSNRLEGFRFSEQHKLHGRPDPSARNLKDKKCDDRPIENRMTCKLQKALGKCSKKWMEDGGYCRRTCGLDPCSSLQIVQEYPGDTSHHNPNGADSCRECDDIPPDTRYTCEQQQSWGKCASSFMAEGGFCRRTCGCKACELKGMQQSIAPGTAAGEATANVIPTVQPTPSPGTMQLMVSTPPNPMAHLPHQGLLHTLDRNNRATIPSDSSDCTTVLEGILGSSDLQILGDVVQASRLSPFMANPLMISTVFLPIDTAIIKYIAKLGITKQEFLANTRLLQQVVRQHIVPNLAMPAKTLAGLRSSILPLAGDPLTPEILSRRIVVSTRSTSGILVAGDLEACRSLVHIVDTVLVS